MKKLLALILAVIMIITAVPLQSFAASGIFTSPIEKLEFADDYPISYKAVQRDGGLSISINIAPYEYKVTAYRKNGKTVKPFYTAMYVNIDECNEALADGKATVPVYVRAYFADFRGRITEYFDQTLEKEIVAEIVKDVTLIGNAPEYDEYGLYDAFVGKEFEIEYADGRKETAKVVYEDYNYTLAGFPISFDDGGYNGGHSAKDPATGDVSFYTGIKVTYMDAVSVIGKKDIPCPFEKVEITDYKFNENANLTEISYTVTYSDGTEIKKTTITDDISDNSFRNDVIDTIDGYDITVEYSSYPGYLTYEGFGILTLYVGPPVWEISYQENLDITDYCNCVCHKKGISYIYFMFMSKIWSILGINEYCKCGNCHF